MVVLLGLLTAVAFLVAEHRLQGEQASGVAAYRLSCLTACGISQVEGLNPLNLHWQADSYPTCHQGSPNVSSIKQNRSLLGSNAGAVFLPQCPQLWLKDGVPPALGHSTN